MPIQEQEKPKVYKPPKKIYSDNELVIFSVEIKPYQIKKILRNGDEFNVTDFNKYYEDQKVIRIEDQNIYIRNTIRYLELQEKVSQFCSYSARKEYGQKMRLESLDTLANQMKIN